MQNTVVDVCEAKNCELVEAQSQLGLLNWWRRIFSVDLIVNYAICFVFIALP